MRIYEALASWRPSAEKLYELVIEVITYRSLDSLIIIIMEKKDISEYLRAITEDSEGSDDTIS